MLGSSLSTAASGVRFLSVTFLQDVVLGAFKFAAGRTLSFPEGIARGFGRFVRINGLGNASDVPSLGLDEDAIVKVESCIASDVEAITAVDATNLVDGQAIRARGRSSVNDGGGGMFWYYASSTQAADGGIVFAPAAGPGRLVRDGWTAFGFNGPVNLAWWGLPMDGVTPCDSAFAAARAYASTLRSCEIMIPQGVFVLNTTQFNRQDAVTWRGAGSGPPGNTGRTVQEFANASATVLKASSTFTLNAPLWVDANVEVVGGRQRYAGGLENVTLWGNGRANGLEVQSCVGASYYSVFTLQCKSWGFKIGAGYDGAGGPIGSCSNNNFTNCDTIFCPIGFVMWGDVTVVSNASLNSFTNCNARGGNTGWSLENCDSNFFYACGGSMVLHADDTGTYSVGGLRSARANVLLGWQGGITAKATVAGTESSYRNVVLGFTKENAATLTVEPGAKLIVMTDQVTAGSNTSGQLYGREPIGVLCKGKTPEVSVPTSDWTDIYWGNDVYDHLGAHGNGSYYVTVPPGIRAVKIDASVSFSTGSSAGVRKMRLLKNSAQGAGLPVAAVSAAVSSVVQMSSCVIPVEPGDVFRFQVWQDSGTTLTALNDNQTWMCVEFL